MYKMYKMYNRIKTVNN